MTDASLHHKTDILKRVPVSGCFGEDESKQLNEVLVAVPCRTGEAVCGEREVGDSLGVMPLGELAACAARNETE